jgi:hypothetical protein
MLNRAKLCLGICIAALNLLATDALSAVKIVPKGDGYELLRNGQPYLIKGVCGSTRLDELVAAGGNSISAYEPGPILDQAGEKGISVLLGLPIRSPRHGFDYSNNDAVKAQLENVRQQVLKYKDHPAVLMWVIGNETELSVSKEDRIRVWKAVQQITEMIKQVDGEHPVITVVAGIGGSKLRELDEYCPALDAVGINTYSGATSLPSAIAGQGWKRPWLLTEFGPRGHWEVGKTCWGVPIEDSSTLKATLYLKAYKRAVEGQPTCLGSYAFLWGQKQEKTHTWYGMFLPEGNRLGAVDAMTMAWTGKWPAQRCPEIGIRVITIRSNGAVADSATHIFPAGSKVQCTVDVKDADGARHTTRWDLRRDVTDNPSSGGDAEPPTPPIKDAVVSVENDQATIQLPDVAGNYRIFVYHFNPDGSAATANLPIQVVCR